MQAAVEAAAEAPKNSGFFGAFAGAFEAFLKVLDDGLEKLNVPYRWAVQFMNGGHLLTVNCLMGAGRAGDPGRVLQGGCRMCRCFHHFCRCYALCSTPSWKSWACRALQ